MKKEIEEEEEKKKPWQIKSRLKTVSEQHFGFNFSTNYKSQQSYSNACKFQKAYQIYIERKKSNACVKICTIILCVI